jgi:biofilm PGA synthesis N-glycosyltransferase PgaC
LWRPCANLAEALVVSRRGVAVGGRGCTRAGDPGALISKATNVTQLVPLTRTPRTHRSEATAALEDVTTVSAHGFADDFEAVLDDTSVHRSTIGCVIPAYNEEESIAQVIEALLGQTRVPDVIHVVVNNTSDATVRIASQYAGAHEIVTELGEQFTEVFVHDIGKNPDKKVGALNYGYTLVEGYDYLLGVDGDTVADAKAVEYLESEATSDTRIGGISEIY